MNRVPSEQTAPGSKVLNECYCYEDPGAHLNLKGKKYTLSLLLFWDLIWRTNLVAQHLDLLFVHLTGYKIQPESAIAQPPKHWPSQLCCHCSATTLWHNTLLLQFWGKNSSQGMPFHQREHLWHRKWLWLLTLKELLNPAQGITKMISQQMGWSVEFSSKSNSLPHHVP